MSTDNQNRWFDYDLLKMYQRYPEFKAGVAKLMSETISSQIHNLSKNKKPETMPTDNTKGWLYTELQNLFKDAEAGKIKEGPYNPHDLEPLKQLTTTKIGDYIFIHRTPDPKEPVCITEVWVNKKTGGLYVIVDSDTTNSTNAQDGQKMIAYKDIKGGKLLVREESEFRSKFDKLSPLTSTKK